MDAWIFLALFLRFVINSDVMEWTHERRLFFTESAKWSGWFCARCCWNVALPASEEDRTAVTFRVREEFRLHDCYAYAQENWKTNI